MHQDRMSHPRSSVMADLRGSTDARDDIREAARLLGTRLGVPEISAYRMLVRVSVQSYSTVREAAARLIVADSRGTA